MTAQALADRSVELGHPLDRSVIAKLEKGHRQTVTVADVLVLALALDVPPVLLLLPFGQTDTAELLPGRDVDLSEAFEWLTGQPTAVSAWRSLPASTGWGEHAEVVNEFLGHRRDLRVWEAARQSAERLRSQAALARAEGRAEEAGRLDKEAESDLDRAEVRWIRLREFRARIRRHGLTPPDLPTALAAREDVGESL